MISTKLPEVRTETPDSVWAWLDGVLRDMEPPKNEFEAGRNCRMRCAALEGALKRMDAIARKVL